MGRWRPIGSQGEWNDWLIQQCLIDDGVGDWRVVQQKRQSSDRIVEGACDCKTRSQLKQQMSVGVVVKVHGWFV